MECSQKDEWYDTTFDGRSLAFVLSVKSTMKDTIALLADRVTEFGAAIHRNMPRWIEKFVIVTIDQNSEFRISSRLKK